MAAVLRLLFGPRSDASALADASDAELARRVCAGESRAAALFFERFAPTIERVICKTLPYPTEWEDAVAEVFSRALGQLATLGPDDKVRSWMVGIAANVAREFRRKSRRPQWQIAGDDMPEVHAHVVDDETRQAARAVFDICASMDENDAELVLLRWFSTMDLNELAELRNVSLATIKRHLSRAEVSFFDLAANEPRLATWVTRISTERGGVR